VAWQRCRCLGGAALGVAATLPACLPPLLAVGHAVGAGGGAVALQRWRCLGGAAPGVAATPPACLLPLLVVGHAGGWAAYVGRLGLAGCMPTWSKGQALPTTGCQGVNLLFYRRRAVDLDPYPLQLRGCRPLPSCSSCAASPPVHIQCAHTHAHTHTHTHVYTVPDRHRARHGPGGVPRRHPQPHLPEHGGRPCWCACLCWRCWGVAGARACAGGAGALLVHDGAGVLLVLVPILLVLGRCWCACLFLGVLGLALCHVT